MMCSLCNTRRWRTAVAGPSLVITVFVDCLSFFYTQDSVSRSEVTSLSIL